MKKLARTAGDGGRLHGTQARVAPSEGGQISLIVRGIRRLIQTKSLDPSVKEDAVSGRERGRDTGAYRSAMDAGVTGGMSLLGAGSRGRKRHR